MLKALLNFFKDPRMAQEFWYIIAVAFTIAGGFALILNNIVALGSCIFGTFIGAGMMGLNKYLADKNKEKVNNNHIRS